jgi:hypothetical protein
MRIKPCWSCGSDGDCYDGCACAKCLDPRGYEEWKNNNPEQYRGWLDSQRIDEDQDWEEQCWEDSRE